MSCTARLEHFRDTMGANGLHTVRKPGGLRRTSSGIDEREVEERVSASTGGGSTQTVGAGAGPAERLGITKGMVVQELGWDEDTDDDLRAAIEDAIDGDMVDGDHGNVVETVLLWWRKDDGDLVDGLVDALTDLAGGGAIWLLTPKVGRPGAVDPADVAEAAPVAGLAQTTSVPVSKDWTAQRLVAPKQP